MDLEISQQVLVGHKAIDQLGDHRRTAEAATDPDFPADFASAIHGGLQANIVEPDGRAILRRAGDGDLELSRQVARIQGARLDH